MKKTKLAAACHALAALTGLALNTGAEAQIDRNLVQKALSEAQKSDPDVRKAVRGTLEAYEKLPKAVKGGESVPASPGHPFGASPLITDQQRADAAEVVIPLMTILRDGDHSNPDEIVKSSQMFEKHMADLPVPKHLNEKLGHIRKCPACAAHVSHMIWQHEEAVAAAPMRQLALFPIGSADLTENARERVRDFAIAVRNHPDARVCLIGRASRIGGWQYNRDLSERRTDAVGGALRIQGVPAEYITTLWLGFDPPQLRHENTRQFGFDELWHRAGQQQMNQSVLMVMYLEKPLMARATEDPDVVVSPYHPFPKVEVKGFKSGNTVIDPLSKKPFVIP